MCTQICVRVHVYTQRYIYTYIHTLCAYMYDILFFNERLKYKSKWLPIKEGGNRIEEIEIKATIFWLYLVL